MFGMRPMIHIITPQNNPHICIADCSLHNSYASDQDDSIHIRWCDTCRYWLHEQCAGQPISRGDLAPSQNQSYLMDSLKKDTMPSDIRIILGWPIRRLLKKFFIAEDEACWHPFSMELVVEMARKWYWANKVLENWHQELTDIYKDTDKEFIESELTTLLTTPYPSYYHCSKCFGYV